MLGAAFTARDAAKAAGKSDAICVSHQLPIWIVRSAIEGRPMLHDPRKRQCSLCSVTTIHFDDDGMITDLTYQEPVKHLLPAKK
jgi:broad specificity phosphatase PhoE